LIASIVDEMRNKGYRYWRAESLIANQSLPQVKNAEDIRTYLPVRELRFEGQLEGLSTTSSRAAGSATRLIRSCTAFLQELVSFFTARLGCNHESFVQIGQVREQEATRLFANHARDWIPEAAWVCGRIALRLACGRWKTWKHRVCFGKRACDELCVRVTANANVRLDAMVTMLAPVAGCSL